MSNSELQRLASECCTCEKCGHVQAEPNWCHECGHRVKFPEWARRLITELDETKKYADEGWDWLDEALDALGAKTVFHIKDKANEIERLRGALLEVENIHTDDHRAFRAIAMLALGRPTANDYLNQLSEGDQRQIRAALKPEENND